ncbi:MAG: thiamine-binding protein [Peptoniphilus sp.]|nr:thiamine-binding protein [Peptoniphilus sp.]MDD7362721.1 thiamine-binding protein [Bacillota bacterium]MDY6044585.1 thiamine-binding protein [Peptoniphilus sp.]
MKASMAIQVLPVTDGGDKEVVRIVDEVIAVIAESGLHYVVAPFETTVEGDSMDEILDLLKKCEAKVMEEGADSVYCYVKLSHGKDSILTIDEKIGKYQ